MRMPVSRLPIVHWVDRLSITLAAANRAVRASLSFAELKLPPWRYTKVNAMLGRPFKAIGSINRYLED
jgi:hypothetical protein